MSNILFTGVLPALISPVNPDGSLRRQAVKPLVDFLIDAGCSGFYICGATGEGVVMQPEARMEMCEATIEACAGRAKIIDHIGAVDLITAKKLAAHAASCGVDAVSSVPPFFYGYDDDGIYNYYNEIAEISKIPVAMYACPLSGVPVTRQLLERLMTIPNMIGLKWTNPNYYEMHKITKLNGGDIQVINGPDETFVCGLTMGAQAGIGSTYNIAPRSFVNIYNAYRDGNISAAQKEMYKVDELIEVWLKHGGVPALKKILQINGFDVGECTYPLKALTENETAALQIDLDKIGYDIKTW